VRYTFTFEKGPQFSGTDSTASHLYLLPGTYTITLTVVDAFDRTDSDSWDESVP
jgi:PKD repeat protein